MMKFFFENKIRITAIALFCCAAMFGGQHIVTAQTSQVTIESIGKKEIKLNTVPTAQDQQVYASDILPTKESYIAGEDIEYIFKLYNATPFDVTALKYKVIVSDALRGDRIFSYEVKGPISLTSGESVKVADTIKAPQSLLQESVVIRVVPVISSGIAYPYSDSKPIVIKGFSPALEMGSWALITNTDNAYPFQAGPSLYQDKQPSSATIDVWLRPVTTAVDLTYNMSVYRRGVELGEKVFSTSSKLQVINPIDARNPDEGGLDVSIPLPVFNYTPGVYEAYIEFVDGQGVIRAPIVIARYTVQGDIAAIQFVRPNKETVTKGETFSVISSITGRPTDIFTNNSSSTVQQVQLFAEIFNEKNQLVGKIDKTISLTEDYFDDSMITALVPAEAMSVHMKVLKGDKVLAEWNNPISASYESLQGAYLEKKENNYMYIIGGLFALVLLILLSFVLKRRKSIANSTPIALLICALVGISSIGLFPKLMHAAPTVDVTFPTEGQILLPGQKFTPRATVYYKACVNWGYDVSIQFFNNGVAIDNNTSIASAPRASAKCVSGPKKGDACTSVKEKSPDCEQRRCSFTDHSIAGPNSEEYSAEGEATAPMVAGQYTILAVATGDGEEGLGKMVTQGSDQNTYIVSTPNLDDGNDGEGGGNPTETTTIPNGGGGFGGGACLTGYKRCSVLSACIPNASVCESPCLSPAIAVGATPQLNTLCKTGFTALSTSLRDNATTNSWDWICKDDTNLVPNKSCSVGCPANSYIDPVSKTCQTSLADWCPNIPGNQTNVTLYRRDTAGNCTASGLIKYFRFSPNTANISCVANWDTESAPGTYFQCDIDGNNVNAQQPEGTTPAVQLPAGGSYTLSCDLKATEGGALLSTTQKSARCFRVGQVREN